MRKGNFGTDFQGSVEQIQAEWMKEAMRNMSVVFGTMLGAAARLEFI
jgi:hypothetical protein